jgi:hypothetical protein
VLAKNLNVTVQWTDRAGNAQTVGLSTSVNGILPLFSASVGVPPLGGQSSGNATLRPFKRHPAVPKTALDQSDGTSKFAPPGAGTVSWFFNNATGVITKVCVSPGVCTNGNWMLLAGFIDFSTGATQPLPSDAENPASTAFDLDLSVTVTGTLPDTTTCYKELFSTFWVYVCAIRVDPTAAPSPRWSGNMVLGGGSLVLATSILDASATRHRVCRYTPVRDCQPAVGSTIWGDSGATASCTGLAPTPSRKMTNEENPLVYVDVTTPLLNQNYLVIRAGDGTDPFTCPADDPASARSNTNTWHHQPSS